MARYVSFRFDDGFLNGARTAAGCLAPDYGTFFLISDLVLGGAVDHLEVLFRGRDFGSVTEWRALANAGHDIQLHGRTHKNMTLLTAEEQIREVRDSLALTRNIHNGPYVFCHPFNAQVDLDFAGLGMSGAGFATRTSDHPMIFHRLTEAVNRFALTSWAVRERHLHTVADQLELLPNDSWIILAFHSFGDEGHEPWSTAAFSSLVATCRELGMKIVTIASMAQRLAA